MAGDGSFATVELMKIIRPKLFFTISGMNSRTTLICPSREVSITDSQSVSDVSINSFCGGPPALQIRTSTLPNFILFK